MYSVVSEYQRSYVSLCMAVIFTSGWNELNEWMIWLRGSSFRALIDLSIHKKYIFDTVVFLFSEPANGVFRTIPA